MQEQVPEGIAGFSNAFSKGRAGKDSAFFVFIRLWPASAYGEYRREYGLVSSVILQFLNSVNV